MIENIKRVLLLKKCKNKRFIMTKPLLYVLVCLFFVSTTIQKNILSPAFGIEINDLTKKRKINFKTGGVWTKITTESHDNRIAEFTFRTNIFFYLNHPENQTPNGLQAMLKNSLNVLIFYPDKEPILGRALMMNDQNTMCGDKEIEEWID